MDQIFTSGDENFRREVADFIASEYPQYLRDKTANNEEYSREDYMIWMRILARKGWLGSSWPTEYGGTGWTLTQRHIFKEELEAAGTIRVFSMGVSMCGPVIQRFGTPEQKARFLPPMVRAETWWCQGFSEPGAGSDLASLRTTAERFKGEDGKDYYRVNGQKTWTTFAQYADWGFFLVRTDTTVKKQAGISFLLIDMASPGLIVRPIETLGGDWEVNEIWLDDVIVPVENRIHDENAGWTCAKYLLQHERSNLAEVSRSKNRIKKLRALAAEPLDGQGGAIIEAPAFRRQIAQLEIELMALEISDLRTLAAINGGEDATALLSMLKTRGSRIAQRATELTMEAAGPHGLIDHGGKPPIADGGMAGPRRARRAADHYLNMRKASIYGGSNEIQMEIIAKRALGL
ncbi:acyl-CoA dehydrogenase family protein [Sphingobium mellinum]|uniref:acyl-CoA dehydrogenase family protein n=1 Tax=Sphingobium mellinum TaxID=1387166 RepID=UPI0030EB24D8